MLFTRYWGKNVSSSSKLNVEVADTLKQFYSTNLVGYPLDVITQVSEVPLKNNFRLSLSALL